MNRLLEQNQTDLITVINQFQISGDPIADLLRAAKGYLNYVDTHRALFLLGIRESYANANLNQAIRQAPELFNQLVFEKIMTQYHLTTPSEKAKQQIHLQNFFTILFGQATLKVTYPDSFLTKPDEKFLNENLRLLAQEIFRNQNT
ncbi:hypothetical protein [Limosilactobacillus alvi]|uniref:hypothetical protein n=1 Tax=Limosilactobacillus alvi TaxID=990412 RepID=UPI001EF5C39F|nr:hypothetical protein [Limosilactobacillus alvi]